MPELVKEEIETTKTTKYYNDNKKLPISEPIEIKKFVEWTSKNVEKREVTGVVLEPEVVDLDLDIYSADVIEKTCNKFNDEVRKMGVQHKDFDGDFKPLQSYVVDTDEGFMTVNGKKCVNGTWILKARAMNDKTWDAVKKGEITGWSIGAWITYVPVEEAA